MRQLQKSDRPTVFVSHWIDDVEPILLDFIKTNVNSFIKWDLIRFFYKNQHIIDTAENIAQYAGRKVPGIEQELDDLVDSGIMVKRGLDGVPIYLLGNDEKMWALMSKFVLACKDRDFRVKVVYHIVLH
jgi:hypothetical protein